MIGLPHSTLLMAGDIVGFYGLLSLALGWLFLRRGDRALLWWIWIGTTVLAVSAAQPIVAVLLQGDLGAVGDAGVEPGGDAYAAGEANWLTTAGTRVTTGLFVTFVAAVALFAHWWTRRPARRGARAVEAVSAVGVWLVTVAGAYALERAGRRGPVEALLRRLMYRPSSS